MTRPLWPGVLGMDQKNCTLVCGHIATWHDHHYNRIATVVPWCNSHWILSLPPLLPHVSGIQIKTGNHSALMGVTTGQSLTVEPSPSPGLAGWVS